ncbi:MAG: mechanosensitive ion channel family protein [Candidatus Woesearchaeota archaeon]
MDFQSLFIGIKNFLSINPYLEAIVYLAVFFILSKLIIYVFEKVFMRLAAKTETTLDDDIVAIMNKPLSWIIFLFGVKLFFVSLWEHNSWVVYLISFINSLMIIFAISTVISIADLVIDYFAKKWASKHTKLDRQLIKLGHQFLLFIGWVVGILLVLSAWGIQIGPLLAGLGIGGLAIAFALQPTLANLFGGVSLILDKSIKVDDVIKLDSGESGKVVDIGLRSTRLLTWTRETLIVPNSKLVDSKIFNFNQPDNVVRVDIEFGVAYGSDIEKVKKLALACTKKQEHILDDPAPSVMFLEMADSSLNFALRFFVDDLSHKWPTHQIVFTKLYNTLNKNKINIPFPQRELWVHNLKK